MTQQEINERLRFHWLWLDNKPNGIRLELSNLDIRGINLRGVNLHKARFFKCDFRGVDLSDSDLSYADFSYCDMRGAYLISCYLKNTGFFNADTRGTNFKHSSVDITKGVSATLGDLKIKYTKEPTPTITSLTQEIVDKLCKEDSYETYCTPPVYKKRVYDVNAVKNSTSHTSKYIILKLCEKNEPVNILPSSNVELITDKSGYHYIHINRGDKWYYISKEDALKEVKGIIKQKKTGGIYFRKYYNQGMKDYLEIEIGRESASLSGNKERAEELLEIYYELSKNKLI